MSRAKEARLTAYSKRVFPSLASLIPISLLAPSVALVVLPFMDDLSAIALGIGLSGLLVIAVLNGAPLVEVIDGDEPLLRVGRAQIELKHVTEVEKVSGAALVGEKGPKLDARAFFVNQAGAKQMAKIHLNDANDPTPYWLFACNDVDALAEAIAKTKVG